MTSSRIQIAAFAVILAGVLLLSRTAPGETAPNTHGAVSAPAAGSPEATRPAEQSVVADLVPRRSVLPQRKWEVLDPEVGAQAASVQLLDTPFSFLNVRTYQSWPLASLTKLITAVVALEAFGEEAKVPVSTTAVATDGTSGDLTSGEVYRARDLLKILLITSSNDAAAALEEYAGGRDPFVARMREKLAAFSMTQTAVYDASGLADENRSTVSDLMKLARHIAEQHPDIFTWTRLPSTLVQPLNTGATRTVVNVNPLVTSNRFLGGKTGTSPAARENLLALFSLGTRRIILILLGSTNRTKDSTQLLQWVHDAYDIPEAN